MIILSFALLLFALFIKAEKRCDVLIKQKADLLKALFPFVIILGHVSFKYPDSIIKDMRFAGPYVVGVFWRTRQTLWSAVQMLTQKLCCQTIHDCPKVVPLHYESE